MESNSGEMLPCKCGGLPYIALAPYMDIDDYFIKCMRCTNCGSVETSEDDAIAAWNKKVGKEELF